MDDYSQPDASEDVLAPPTNTRKGGGNAWRRANPAKARESLYRWRVKRTTYKAYQRRYMADRRERARKALLEDPEGI